MQVRNQVIFGLNPAKTPKNNSEGSISFKQPPIQPQEKEPEEKKGGLSVKTATNVLGVALGMGAIAGYIIMRYRRPSAQKLIDRNEKLQKGLSGIISDIKEAAITKEGKNNGFKLGEFFNKLSEKNQELFNNLVYGFGTVVVMPLVILFSPLGKKDASKEDKVFTVLRQPLSFITMFSMQLTVDKFFKGLTPKFVKKNIFEDKAILTSDGKGINESRIEDIKYNTDAYKTEFKKNLTKLAKDRKDDIEELFKINDIDTAKEHLKKILNGADFDNMAKSLEKYLAIKGRQKLLGEALVITTNVLFAAPVGCTLLNVIYGKFMKTFHSSSPDKAKENMVKGGQK